MKVKDHKKYACFDYISNECNNPFKLGDVVFKAKEWDKKTPCNEVGIVLQIHDNGELRTDMFGNEHISVLKLATKKQIKKYRPSIEIDLDIK